MKGETVIHFVHKVSLCVSTAAVNRNKRKVLSVEKKVKLIQQTESGKEKSCRVGSLVSLTIRSKRFGKTEPNY